MPIDPLSILGLGIELVKQISKTVSPKVAIKPKSFTFSGGEWSKTNTVIVQNKSGDAIFDVQIVMYLTNKNSHIEIEIENQKNGHEENMGAITINTDSLVISGERNGKSFKLLQVNYLAPNSTRRIFIMSKEAGKISLGIVKFSKTPNNITKKQGSVALPFIPPFDMQLQAVSLLLKRNIGNHPTSSGIK